MSFALIVISHLDWRYKIQMRFIARPLTPDNFQ